MKTRRWRARTAALLQLLVVTGRVPIDVEKGWGRAGVPGAPLRVLLLGGAGAREGMTRGMLVSQDKPLTS